jgi:hypothetical protein
MNSASVLCPQSHLLIHCNQQQLVFLMQISGQKVSSGIEAWPRSGAAHSLVTIASCLLYHAID